MSVFVFVVKEAFDLPCLPQDHKDEIEISELVEDFNKRLTEFFVFTAKRELDENFFSFFGVVSGCYGGKTCLSLLRKCFAFDGFLHF